MDNFKKAYLSSFFLYILKELKDDLVFKNFINLLKIIDKEYTFELNIEAYMEFVYSLKKMKYDNFSLYLENFILKNKTYVHEEQFKKELEILSLFTEITYEDIKNRFCEKFSNYKELLENLPKFENTGIKISLEEIEKEDIKDNLFEKNRAFIFDNDFEIKPIKVCENTSFSSLKGYVEQKRVLFDNTSAFLSGAKVNNILLYGDA